mgnify:CR=1 FL=1
MKNNIKTFKEVVDSLPTQFSSEQFMQRLASKGACESTIKKGLKYLPNLATRTAKGNRRWIKIEQQKVVATPKAAKDEPIFKVGDRVYCGIIKRWGVVEEINYEDLIWRIRINFVDFKNIYTNSGSRALGYAPSLSFTEYDFVNGGFSQVRPLPKIERDTLIYVKSGDTWLMCYFAGFTKEGYIEVYNGQATSVNAKYTLLYREWSLTNPLEQK